VQTVLATPATSTAFQGVFSKLSWQQYDLIKPKASHLSDLFLVEFVPLFLSLPLFLSFFFIKFTKKTPSVVMQTANHACNC
jgi:hypothetical protein